MRKLPITITEEELIKILKATKNNQLKLSFALGFYECMRISEIIRLKQEDINKNLKLVYIKQGKGKKDRNIPLAPEIEGAIKHIPIKYSIRTLQREFKKACLKILNKDLHFHCLRHSGITHYLVKKGWNSLQVQRLAGHSKISTTQLYTHINPSDLVNKMWDSE